METIIKINKNKPAFKALILLAKELEKNDHTSISVKETKEDINKFNLLTPKPNSGNPFLFFDQLSDFPTLNELRTQAWPKI
jgi:hypothetical protein